MPKTAMTSAPRAPSRRPGEHPPGVHLDVVRVVDARAHERLVDLLAELLAEPDAE